jgi:hypothetical protein
MVERPIKKSERTTSDPESSSEPRTERRDRKKGKSDGGRGERHEKPPANPALMRGPRPSKAKPILEESVVVLEELTPEELTLGAENSEADNSETESSAPVPESDTLATSAVEA